MPSHKIGCEYYYTYGSLADVDQVISDVPLPAEWQEMVGKNRK
jgi:DeoR/GlpR family transcriptional regulator of sugar metabolism